MRASGRRSALSSRAASSREIKNVYLGDVEPRSAQYRSFRLNRLAGASRPHGLRVVFAAVGKEPSITMFLHFEVRIGIDVHVGYC